MQELNYPFDPSYIIKKRKSIKRELLADGSARIKKKIAVFGGSTTNEIINTLELFLLNAGIEAEFYESEYAQYEQDAVFPSEELLSFKPDIVFVHTTNRNIRNLPEVTDSKEIVEEKLKAEFARFENIWNSIRDKFHCPIIQNNFEMPFYRLMGNKDCSDYRGRTNFISRLNQAFYDFAEKTEGFYINDINYLSADYGLKEWSNPSFWNMYKYAMCFEAIPSLAFSVSNIIKSIFGKNKKALALDLDNTLWGGVVGDDGVDGIEIGQENGVSQSYYEFQSYIKQLKSLGIILTVCSKNDHENAIAGLNHPEGILKPDDFIIIKANWENKDRNIAETAAELNILPESIVFVDDNPAEREIVKAQLKGVQAPVMDSVENYITTIDRSGFFEVTTFNEDDLKRNEMYKENAMRNAQQASFADYGEYLKSLDMKATIGDFIPVYIARITQLTNKSNQFNLTTKRYTQTEMEEVWHSPNYIRLYGKLIDKFGDNGVVSVVIGEKREDTLHIDLWLMSCRVLKRDMEQAMLDTLVEKCRQNGISKIRGYYYPTKKNGMVRELYGTFGFTKISEDENGNTVWELPIEGYENQNRYIEVSDNE
ncbi:MAG: HAD-IIIC family phosphatase [Candidatus Pseudoruminococcus sp.]|nr:HAD-IIIC family phosphatase [Ruminococcus sp.]MDY2782924.1 HAD-IIIC family phosphatase [Candidatus Pseudoruminococcus sp.]